MFNWNGAFGLRKHVESGVEYAGEWCTDDNGQDLLLVSISFHSAVNVSRKHPDALGQHTDHSGGTYLYYMPALSAQAPKVDLLQEDNVDYQPYISGIDGKRVSGYKTVTSVEEAYKQGVGPAPV